MPTGRKEWWACKRCDASATSENEYTLPKGWAWVAVADNEDLAWHRSVCLCDRCVRPVLKLTGLKIPLPLKNPFVPRQADRLSIRYPE